MIMDAIVIFNRNMYGAWVLVILCVMITIGIIMPREVIVVANAPPAIPYIGMK